jgi:hypothetical protein
MISSIFEALVAQRIEHLTTDQKVRGSNPFGRTRTVGRIDINFDQENLTIVIVGRYTEDSVNLIHETRSKYPKCTIVISSFDKEKFKQFKFQNIQVIDSNLEEGLVQNHIAQQKLIMQAEDYVNTDYVLKIRTDLLSTIPIEWIEKSFKSIYLDSRRVVVTQFFTKNPRFVNQFGHPSDMVLLGHKSNIFNYFRISQKQNHLGEGYLAPEQLYFFSHSLCYPKHTYSFNLNVIRSHIKLGKIFYIVNIENFEKIFPARFVKNNNFEIVWKDGNFIQHGLITYIFFSIVNKFNLRRFSL